MTGHVMGLTAMSASGPPWTELPGGRGGTPEEAIVMVVGSSGEPVLGGATSTGQKRPSKAGILGAPADLWRWRISSNCWWMP